MHESCDRDDLQTLIASQQNLGLIGDRHVHLPRRQQLQRFRRFGRDDGLDIQADRPEVTAGDRRVKRRVIGVGEPIEHYRERLRAGR
jgi:hypothetical protein